MPLHERHRQQRTKNWVLFLLLIAFIMVIYAITMFKFELF